MNPRLSLPLFSTVLLGCLVSSASLPGQSKQPPSNKVFWAQVFSGKRVLEVHFRLTKANYDAMWPRGGGREQSYPYVEADLEVAGQKLAKIGLRFKGNSSFRGAAGMKQPFKLDTNKYVPKQKLFGRTKLSFSTAYKDPTFLREKLGQEVFAAAGLPTAGVGWAVLYLTVDGLHDNERIGLYNVVEQIDDRFLGRKLGKASKRSVLMKPDRISNWDHLGDDPKRYVESYGVKEGATEAALLGRLAAFTKLVHTASDAEFAEKIFDYLDADNMASYLAANCLLGNLDSYVSMIHNYYLVVDAADQKIKILPWDLNESFGSFTMGTSPEELQRWSIQRPWASERRVLSRLFEVPAFRSKYEGRVRALMKGAFRVENLRERIAALRPIVEKHLGRRAKAAMAKGIEGDKDAAANRPRDSFGGRSGPGGGRGGGPALLPFIEGRVASVQQQLAGKAKGAILQGRGRGGPGRRR